MSVYSPPLDWTGIKVPEAALQRTAIQLLKTVGWKVFVDRMAWKSDPGWLDVTAVHPKMRRTLFLENKAEDGKLSATQKEWIAAHEAAGNEVFVLRPSKWEEFVRLVVPPEMLG